MITIYHTFCDLSIGFLNFFKIFYLFFLLFKTIDFKSGIVYNISVIIQTKRDKLYPERNY